MAGTAPHAVAGRLLGVPVGRRLFDVMKGTEVPARARWQGNPAREVSVAEPVQVRMRI